MSIIRNFGGGTYRAVMELGAGNTIYFLAGARIAIEKWEMRPGRTNIEFQVNSRATRDGRPISIATNEETLRDEFIERTVAGRQVVPISVGELSNLRQGRAPSVALTYGEASPQIFQSTVRTRPVAWTVAFRDTRHAGMGGARMRRPSGAKASQAGQLAREQAEGAARLRAVTSMTFLRIFVNIADVGSYRVLDEPIGNGDVTGRRPSLIEQMMSRVGL